jgi:hypothetical protein
LYATTAGLLDDAYSLSLVRQMNVTTFLGLAKALGARFKPELPPWGIGLGWLQVIALQVCNEFCKGVTCFGA